jgi:hypothetical protein
VSAAAFFSVAAVVCAALLAVEVAAVFTWLAELAATAEEARSALLTEGVFKEADDVRRVALPAPREICAEDDWLIVNATPAIRQVAMKFLVFIVPFFSGEKSVCLYISRTVVLLPPEIKKNNFPIRE